MFDVNLHKAYVMENLSRTFMGFLFIFLPLFLVTLGFNGFQIGFLVSLYAVTALFSIFPTGIINDRYDIRYVLLLGYSMMSFFGLAVTFTDDFFLLIIIFLIGGFGQNFVQSSLQNIIFKEHAPRREGKKFGKYRLYSNLGFAAGLIAGGFITQLFSFIHTLRFIGIFYALMFFVTFWLAPTKVSRTRLTQYKTDFFKLHNVLFAVIIFLFATHWGAEKTSYALFIKTAFNLDMIYSGFFIAIPIIILGISAYTAGRKIDKRTDFKKLFMYGMFISGVFHVLMVNPNVYLSFICRIFHEMGDGMTSIAILFWVSKKFIRKRIGGDAGLFTVTMIMGEFAGALIYGSVGEIYGWGIPLVVSGWISIFCSLLFIVLKNRLD